MFQYCLEAPLRVLSLNARQHSLINSNAAAQVEAALKRDKWTCCKCGTKLNNLMEVHHHGGHRATSAKDLSAICAVCHDREHPIWSASQCRWFPIYAPDWSQIYLSRLSWALLADGKSGLDTAGIRQAIGDREERAYEYLGTDNMESLIEALFSVHDQLGLEAARQAAKQMDACIRIMPTSLRVDTPMKIWTPEGFRPLTQRQIDAALSRNDPDSDTLRELARGLVAQVK